MSEYLNYTEILQNPILLLIVAYFIGVVISRFGSIVIAPCLSLFLSKKHTYQEYLCAEKSDAKIQSLVEDQNLYRSIISLLIISYFSIKYLDIRSSYEWIQKYEYEIFFINLVILFILAYAKQSNFINGRVLSYLRSTKNPTQ